MMWLDRVNGNGVAFRQWHATREFETPPAWGPDESFIACPVCGEQYAQQYVTISGEWVPSSRYYVYHDPLMHKGYRRDGVDAAVNLNAPHEIAHD